MIISVINMSNGTLSDGEVQRAIRAVNRQIKDDFVPYWGMGATLRLEGGSTASPGIESAADMRGDAVLYIWDKKDMDDADGYHATNNRGIPYGFVFLKIVREMGEDWTITFSHEALELLADPYVNMLVAGPHPEKKENKRKVFYWFEMSDPVQNESYEIDGVKVSNFVLPQYFTSDEEDGARNDFLGTQYPRRGCLKSFGVNPGGYCNYYDPQTHRQHSYSLPADEVAEKRMEIKSQIGASRRAMRYRSNTDIEAKAKGKPKAKGKKKKS